MTQEEERLQRRQWAERDAQEDLRKKLEHILADVHEESISGKTNANDVPMVRAMARLASLIGNVYLRAEIQTKKVVRLTWALAGLTLGLLILTGYLCYDAYLKRERDEKTETSRSEPKQPKPEVHLTVPY